MQLSLFGERDPMKAVYEDAAQVAARLPPWLRFGTSSWSFPGWRGLVYAAAATTQQLAQEGLREYARHPLLRTVGLDRSFYAPIPEADLRRYATQLPAGFPCLAKLPSALVTTAIVKAGGPATPNPDFLSAERFDEWVAQPFRAAFAAHAGPFLVEIPQQSGLYRLPASELLARLDAFLAALPRDFQYAVELRDAGYLLPAYRAILERHGVGHVYSYWRDMPLPAQQARLVPPSTAPFVVVRLSLKPGRFYDDEKARYAPFDRIVEPDPELRRDVGELALATGNPTYVLVNNKAEGSSPLTIRALADAVASLYG